MTIGLLSQVQDAVEAGLVDDMNEMSSGGGGRGLLPAGDAFIRLSTYVEFGVQQLPAFNGTAKQPHMTFQLGAHIVGGTGVSKDGEDEDYVQEEGRYPYIRTFETPLYRNEKAKATKWFNAINTKGQFKTFAQALGKLYIIPVKIEKAKKDPTKFVNVYEWDKVREAVDPMTRKPYNLPDIPVDNYKLLLWNKPTKEQWESIFIEGTWEAKDGKPAQSKNVLQETCLKAQNFKGSALEQVIAELGGGFVAEDLTDNSVDVSAVPEPDAVVAIPDVPEI